MIRLAGLLFVLFMSVGAAEAAASCGITGTVGAIERVERSAWEDGAPSAFSTVETRITVRIKERSAHIAENKNGCTTAGDKEKRTYKLCSPTPVKAGDTIRAVEGVETGTNDTLGCLFDISVHQSK